jgi:hypothetical protein
MPKKKETPPIPQDLLPTVFNVYPQPDGRLAFKIGDDFQEVSGFLTPEYSVALLSKWVMEIYEKARDGGSLENTPFAKASIKLHPKADKYTAEEQVEMLNRFLNEAVIQAMRSILVRMVKLPAQAFIEAIISIVLDMEESELIKIEGSRADIWNEYTEGLGRTVKGELNIPLVLKPRRWNKSMRRKAVKIYENTLDLLRKLKKIYHSTYSAKIRQRNPELKTWDEAKKDYPDLEHLLKLLAKGASPGTLALQYTCECLGSVSEATTWDQIKRGRWERKELEKKRAQQGSARA